MAIGDFLVRNNSADTSALPNTGSTLTTLWDNEDKKIGTGMAYSAGSVTLGVGIYLIMYSERFDTTNTTNNERITASGEIFSGASPIGGYSGDYIRKSSGQQEMILSGSMIYEVTTGTENISIRFHRTDNSTSGTVNRVPGHGGFQIVQLDGNHAYGLYTTSASEATSGTTVRTLNVNTNTRQDTGFSRTGSSVTVSTAGRYYVTYSMDISTTGTAREDIVGFLRRNGTTPVVGSYSYLYLRGSDASQAGGLTWQGIVDVTASDSFDVRWSAPQSATMTAAAGATLQFWKLPTGNKTAIAEATTGDYNANAVFTWDTNPQIDTDYFTHTAGTTGITTDNDDYTLAFTTFSQAAPDTPQRAYPEVRFRVDTVLDDTAAAGVYHRNNGGSGIVAVTNASILNTPANSVVDVQTTPLATTGAMNNDSGQFALVSLSQALGVNYFTTPSISTYPSSIQYVSTNVTITGVRFEATQGTGKVELWSDITGTTKVTQSIDTWSDTSIQFDVVQGALTGNTAYLVVTATNNGESTPKLINIPNPTITVYPDNIKTTSTNLSITGTDFYATQGTGKLELWSDAIGTIKVTQTIDIWNNTSIQFDVVQGTLTNNTDVYLVVTNSAGHSSTTYITFMGIQPYNDYVKSLNPDIYYRMQNNWTDTMGNHAGTGVGDTTGTPTYTTVSLTSSSTVAWTPDATTTIHEIANSTYTNSTGSRTMRYIGMWVQIDKIYKTPSGMWEEGGGVNNFYMALGFGNTVLFNGNDAGDWAAQSYSDIKLTPNRPYFLLLRFEGTGFGGLVTGYVNGKRVAKDAGTQPNVATMVAHSGGLC